MSGLTYTREEASVSVTYHVEEIVRQHPKGWE